MHIIKLTAFLIIASAAITHAAETLAISVPNGIHFNNPVFPKPRPLSRAKNHLIHTPRGPTMQPNHSWASLLPLLNSFLSNITLTNHSKPSIRISTAIIPVWHLQLSTLQLLLEMGIPPPKCFIFFSSRCLKPLAVSIPKIIE